MLEIVFVLHTPGKKLENELVSCVRCRMSVQAAQLRSFLKVRVKF